MVRQAHRDPVIFVDDLGQISQPLSHRIENSMVSGQDGFLWHIPDCQLRCTPDDTVIESALACNYFEQAALAATVTANQPNTLTRFDDQRYAREQRMVSVSKRCIVQGD